MPEENIKKNIDSIFTKIINGDIPSTKIYENAHTYAFLDIQPNNIGHTLVVPKNPSINIFEMKEEDIENLFITVKKIAVAVKSGTDATGVNIAMNNGTDAGQEVFYSHIHIIPRFPNDGFEHGRHLKYEEGQMEKVAEKIRENL